jgi:hypothetical protein
MMVVVMMVSGKMINRMVRVGGQKLMELNKVESGSEANL